MQIWRNDTDKSDPNSINTQKRSKTQHRTESNLRRIAKWLPLSDPNFNGCLHILKRNNIFTIQFFILSIMFSYQLCFLQHT